MPVWFMLNHLKASHESIKKTNVVNSVNNGLNPRWEFQLKLMNKPLRLRMGRP